jgi:hypothetical protein
MEVNAPCARGKEGKTKVGVAGEGTGGSVAGGTTLAKGRVPLSGTVSGSQLLVVGLKV